MKTLFVDTETTGTEPMRHGMIQISGLVFIDGEPVDAFDLKTNVFHGDAIDDEALAVNGITREQLKTFPPPSECLRSLLGLLDMYCERYQKKDKFHFIGYNADFDARFVRRFFERNGNKFFGAYFWWPIIDVSKLAGLRLMSTRHELSDFKLMTVAKHMGLEIDESRLHDASYDIEVTMKMFRRLAEDVPQISFMRGKV